MMTSSHLITVKKDALQKILPDWTINDDLECVSKKLHYIITEQQCNKIASLGLVMSENYRSFDTVVISFMPMRGGFD